MKTECIRDEDGQCIRREGAYGSCNCRERYCESCYWWFSLVEGGQCRLKAPIEVRADGDPLVGEGVWPRTWDSDWCGEWRNKV